MFLGNFFLFNKREFTQFRFKKSSYQPLLTWNPHGI